MGVFQWEGEVLLAFPPSPVSWLYLCRPRAGGGWLCSHLHWGLPNPAWGSKGEMSRFQCYAEELKNDILKKKKLK